MEELLKKLGIQETEDLEVIREKLEEKQVEYLERLDNVEDNNRRNQIKDTLHDIESVLLNISWLFEKMNKGLVLEKDYQVVNKKYEDKTNVQSLKNTNNKNSIPPSLSNASPLNSSAAQTVQSSVVNTSGISPKLQRAFIYLESEDWNKADAILEDVLNEDPTNCKAYVGKLMSEIKISKENEIITYSASIKNNTNYKLALKYADPDYYRTLRNYNDYIEKSILYKAALKEMLNAKNEQSYIKAADLFENLGNFQDAPSKANECKGNAKHIVLEEEQKKQSKISKEKNNLYDEAVSYINKNNYNDTQRAIHILKNEKLKGFLNAPQLLKQCEDKLTEQKYLEANEQIEKNNTYALELFTQLGEYKDSKSKKEELTRIIQKQEVTARKAEKEKEKEIKKKEYKRLILGEWNSKAIVIILLSTLIYSFINYRIYGLTSQGLVLTVIAAVFGSGYGLVTLAAGSIITILRYHNLTDPGYIADVIATAFFVFIVGLFPLIRSKTHYPKLRKNVVKFILLYMVGDVLSYVVIFPICIKLLGGDVNELTYYLFNLRYGWLFRLLP